MNAPPTVVTKKFATGNWTPLGKLIEFLRLDEESSPALCLDDGVLVVELKTQPGGSSSLYLQGVKPQDLDIFRSMILQIDLPNNLRRTISYEAWEKAKEELFRNLTPHAE